MPWHSGADSTISSSSLFTNGYPCACKRGVYESVAVSQHNSRPFVCTSYVSAEKDESSAWLAIQRQIQCWQCCPCRKVRYSSVETNASWSLIKKEYSARLSCLAGALTVPVLVEWMLRESSPALQQRSPTPSWHEHPVFQTHTSNTNTCAALCI
jgi:hypothetical protein